MLDGAIQGFFGEVFGGLYLDATLHRRQMVKQGAALVPIITDEPVKYQPDRVTEAMRAERFTDEDANIIILQIGPAGYVRKPSTDDEITTPGQFGEPDIRWKISGVDSDPANSYWQFRATPLGTAEGV